MARVKNKATPRKSGVSHAIKKPKVTTAKRNSTGTALTKIAIKKEEETGVNRRLSRRILVQVENLPLTDNNQNPRSKTIKQEIKEEVKEEPIGDIKSESTEDEQDYDDEEMSSYERLRLKNIQEREEMFRALMDSKKRVSDVFNTPTQTNKRTVSQRGLASTPKEKEILPARKSARLAGGKVPEISRYVPELTAEPEHNPPPLETLKAEDLFKYDEDEMKLAHAKQFFNTYTKQSKPGKIKSSTSSKQFFQNLKNWTITADKVAKVTPNRIFSVAVHPSEHKILASAGGKWGGLGLWDMNDKDSKENGVYLFNPHGRPINWQSWDEYNSQNLITTSYDGTCRILDIEKMESRLLYGDEKFLEKHGNYCTQHQQIDANTFLVTKGKTGCLGMVDIRAGYESCVEDYHVYDRVSPKCLSVHPVQKNIVCTSNNKGGTFIFDIRNGKCKSGGLMEPVAQLIGHPRSVSSAVFNCTGNKVATMCWDDKLRLFDTSVIKGDIKGKETKHNNNTGRWLTPFKALWHPVHEDVYFTGSMRQPREIEAWQATSTLDRVHCLRGDDLSSVISVMAVHPSLDVLVGGNASGRLYAFS